MAPSLPIAGWYPDPELPGHDRWWDGTTWSENRRTAGTAIWVANAGATPPAPPSAPRPVVRNNLALIGFILSLSGFLVPIVLNSLAGGIVSAVGLRQSKKLAGNGIFSNGRGLSIAGILIGFVWAALCLLFIAAWIAFYLWIVSTTQNLPSTNSPVI